MSTWIILRDGTSVLTERSDGKRGDAERSSQDRHHMENFYLCTHPSVQLDPSSPLKTGTSRGTFCQSAVTFFLSNTL
ncbi:hypothetical protein CRI94_14125 [Longibacter salinarum]|uniref:Uncharacterized protein n=1 Tax=Longibacter salinarum TaxID=1850348 RepID=A0A2A8CVM3_9BACT|nr:hypothetical protein CRI94_14125 [Longibacter salinarum]